MYTFRPKYLAKLSGLLYSTYAIRDKVPTWFVWTLAVLLPISAGITYRLLASHLNLVVETPISLPVSLSAFPRQIGHWEGKDVRLAEDVQRIAQNDDFVSRLYINNSNREWANLYIAYSARPRTMVGHRPEICYVGGGWIHDGTEPSELISKTGRQIPCLIHRFHMPGPHYEEIVVLNFYILNGQITADQSAFTGIAWRTPNIGGDPARYVAQVQISSALESSTRTAAQHMADLILDFFPDESGKVRATELWSTAKDVLK